MNGPEHYRAAEFDIERANDRPMGGEAEFMLARAQVHATLALAAATIESATITNTLGGGATGPLTNAWDAAVGQAVAS